MGSWVALWRTGSRVPAGAVTADEQGNSSADTESQAVPAGHWKADQSRAERQETAGEHKWWLRLGEGVCCAADLFLISLGNGDRASESVCLTRGAHKGEESCSLSPFSSCLQFSTDCVATFKKQSLKKIPVIYVCIYCQNTPIFFGNVQMNMQGTRFCLAGIAGTHEAWASG